MIVLLDNRDSFVHNLADEFFALGETVRVFRNTVSTETVLAALTPGSVLCLSPGPGRPEGAGNMMELVSRTLGRVPLLGICLGLQALALVSGGAVRRVSAVHGEAHPLTVTPAGEALFGDLGALTVARYHSLGVGLPPEYAELAHSGGVTMAAAHREHAALGLQFHPESVLSPQGRELLRRSLAWLRSPGPLPGQPTQPPARARLGEALRRSLSEDEARELFAAQIRGELSPAELGALLGAMRARGESPEELAGAARAFLAAARPFPRSAGLLADSAGTGGDHSGSLNISTAAALTAASLGVRVAKHGNRSVTSRSGSADVIEALGLPAEAPPAVSARALEGGNFAFLSAPQYHPGVAGAMGVRRALGVPTLFNLLGPLLNPARPDVQLVGVAQPQAVPLLADTLVRLGVQRALVVHGSGLDEIALHGPTVVAELKRGERREFTLNPEDLGLDAFPLEALRGGDARENAALLRAALGGSGPEAHRQAIAASAGALLYLAGEAGGLKEGVQAALAALNAGGPLAHLEGLVGT